MKNITVRSVWLMVLNAIFNNISFISWWSVLLVEVTGVPGENHWSVASHRKLYHIMLYRVHLDIIQCVLTRSDHISETCSYISAGNRTTHSWITVCVPLRVIYFRYSEYNNSYTIIIIKVNVLLPKVYVTLTDLRCPV